MIYTSTQSWKFGFWFQNSSSFKKTQQNKKNYNPSNLVLKLKQYFSYT